MAVPGAVSAIARVEGAASQRVLSSVGGLDLPGANAFGDRVLLEPGPDAGALLRHAAKAAGLGERVAVVARARELAAARADLAHLAARGLGVVVHCVLDVTDDAAADESSAAAAQSLGDLGWGVLVASTAREAVDLSLVARRAAEDSGCPFLLIHDLGAAPDDADLAPPDASLCHGFLGAARPAPATPGSSRGVAERVPFALGSALRELESIAGRRQDVLERSPATPEPSLALVGAGAIGRRLIDEVTRLRAAGHDVGAVRVVALRPFPGPRLVKALARATAITVLEGVGRPLGASGPLAAELKAAFSDALTWAPGYPGIGRIPRIAAGVAPGAPVLSPSDLDALVQNMILDDRGKRTFVLESGPDGRRALC